MQTQLTYCDKVELESGTAHLFRDGDGNIYVGAAEDGSNAKLVEKACVHGYRLTKGDIENLPGN